MLTNHINFTFIDEPFGSSTKPRPSLREQRRKSLVIAHTQRKKILQLKRQHEDFSDEEEEEEVG